MPIPGWKKLRRLLSRQLEPRDACEICGRGFQPGNLTVGCLDHHGDTARGWLCGACNVGLGLAGENPRILRRMAAYLESRPHSVKRWVDDDPMQDNYEACKLLPPMFGVSRK